MLEELRSTSNLDARPLRARERKLVEVLLSDTWTQADLDARLASSLVEDMQDGGMGSIRFLSSCPMERHVGETLAEAEYIDEDGVPVSIVINVDSCGELFEVDIWKVNFSPLLHYPDGSNLNVKHRKG